MEELLQMRINLAEVPVHEEQEERVVDRDWESFVVSRVEAQRLNGGAPRIL